MNDPAQIPLKDIHLPAAVSWWPPAAGWWLLLLIVVLAAAGIWWWYRASEPRRLTKRLRRVAGRDIDHLLAEYRNTRDGSQSLQELSILLRRVAMTFSPRGRVAGLSGEKWTGWLAATDVRCELDSRALEILADGPYQRTHGNEVEAVIERCRRWLNSFDPEAAGRDPV